MAATKKDTNPVIGARTEIVTRNKSLHYGGSTEHYKKSIDLRIISIDEGVALVSGKDKYGDAFDSPLKLHPSELSNGRALLDQQAAYFRSTLDEPDLVECTPKVKTRVVDEYDVADKPIKPPYPPATKLDISEKISGRVHLEPEREEELRTVSKSRPSQPSTDEPLDLNAVYRRSNIILDQNF